MDKKIRIEIIEGVEGDCLSMNNYRIAGPKPWGGGRVSSVFTTDVRKVLQAIGFPIGSVSVEFATHDLYKNGDPDAPNSIKDRNGEVVLGACRRCKRGEIDLQNPCEVIY